MSTERTPEQLEIRILGCRGGSLLLRETHLRLGMLSPLATCSSSTIASLGSVEHDVRTLVSQRVYGLALG